MTADNATAPVWLARGHHPHLEYDRSGIRWVLMKRLPRRWCSSTQEAVADQPLRKDCWMRALQYTAYGGPEVLEWGDAADPHAGPGHIRIAVRAASVNPIDWKTFAGVLSGGQPMAGTGYLGYDAAGVVDEVGEGVRGVSVGDDVLGRGRNTQAEYAVLDSWAAKPPSIDWAVAAAAGVAGETAERGLRLLDVNAGDTIFVDGGAGGVGAAAVQMAIARGARVIASSSEANHDYLREIGATPVLYGEGVVSRVRAAAGGPGRRCL